MKDNPFVTNNKNKIRLSFLISGLALVLLLAFSGAVFLSSKNAQAAVSYWTNSSYRASSYAGGTGTSSNPYKITNGKELALMAYHVNNISGYASKYYSLQNNVSLVAPDKNGNQLVWEPIGTSKIFNGTFWGNGHTISGLYISETTSDYAGLFGQVSGNVESLRVEGTIMLKKSTVYVGGIIAKKTGTNTVSKLTSNVNILTNSKYVGCVIGYNTSYVEQCISLGSIVGEVIDEQCFGGIAGYSSGSISDCYNKGNISGELHEDTENGIGYNYVGGIVGRISSASIKNCFNLGSIDEGSGIVDFAEDCSGIFNCYNKGTISDGSGIAGYIKNTSITLNVEDCYNFGGIYYGKAGLVGAIYTSEIFTIKNCYNEGYVIGLGGLIGSVFTPEAFYIQYCYNAGDVQNNIGYRSIGGIVGELHRTYGSTISGTVSNCKNTGTIKNGTASYGAAGGIIGFFSGCEITFMNLLNQGRVVGSEYVGGIFGNFGGSDNYTNSNIVSCVNYGTVCGSKGVGGIIGIYYPSLNSGIGTFMKCINFGSIMSTENGSECLGGIVGSFKTKGGGEIFTAGPGGTSISHCINYGIVNDWALTQYYCVNAGGIVGYFDSTNVKDDQPRNFILNCLNVGQVYSNPSSYKGKQYIGSMVGRNVKDEGSMNNIGYYCSDTGIKAFGTKSRKSIDDSNGLAYSRTLAEILTSYFVGDWSTWCEYKTRSSLKNDKLQAAITKVEAAYDKTMSGLVLLKNIDYDGLKLNFDFMDQQTGSTAVWAKDNPLINNGEPYFKDRYW